MGIYQKGTNWYIDYYVKGNRKRKKIGPSKKLAEQVLRDVHAKIVRKDYLGIYEEKKITFDEQAQQYMAYCKTNKASTTYRRDQISIKQLTSAFKGRYLFDITPQMIEKYKLK